VNIHTFTENTQSLANKNFLPISLKEAVERPVAGGMVMTPSL